MCSCCSGGSHHESGGAPAPGEVLRGATQSGDIRKDGHRKGPPSMLSATVSMLSAGAHECASGQRISVVDDRGQLVASRSVVSVRARSCMACGSVHLSANESRRLPWRDITMGGPQSDRTGAPRCVSIPHNLCRSSACAASSGSKTRRTYVYIGIYK